MTDEREWTRTLARRILFRIPRFTPIAEGESRHHDAIPDDATVIGEYASGDDDVERVVVCDDGVLFHDGGWVWVRYSEMSRLHVARTESKVMADKIVVDLESGPRTMTSSGGDGKFRDVFEFSRFLARASELHRKTPTAF